MNFSIINLGCKVNRTESDTLTRLLTARSLRETVPEQADLIVVNTCTVTGEAEKKTRKAVHRALRANSHAPVVVTGCAAAINPEEFTSMDPRVRVVGKDALESSIIQLVGEPDTISEAAPSVLNRSRIGVKVQDGCNHSCSYCIVHVARGPSRSRDGLSIGRDVVDLACRGIGEVVLSGINLGSYGHPFLEAPLSRVAKNIEPGMSDKHDGSISFEKPNATTTDAFDEHCQPHKSPGSNEAEEHGKQPSFPIPEGPLETIVDLLQWLLQITAEPQGGQTLPLRFRLSSIEPMDISDALIELVAESDGRICRHLHLPVQSGSSRVLAEMKRPYDAETYLELVERLRLSLPELSLSTDIIVGFPGETDKDFEATLNLARACGFSKIHVFPYSQRAGTPAALRHDQISPEVKSRRAKDLRALATELRARDFQGRIGRRELAVVEQPGRAMTESYYEVPVSENLAKGLLVPLTIARSAEPLVQLLHD